MANYDKLQDVIQSPNENPTMFLNWLAETLIRYTKKDPESPLGCHDTDNQFYFPVFSGYLEKAQEGRGGPPDPYLSFGENDI